MDEWDLISDIVGEGKRNGGANYNHDSIETLKRTISRKDFKDFANVAYRSPQGYVIRRNPITKKVEMFVAGSRNFPDWRNNFTEYIGMIDIDRYEREAMLSDRVLSEGVQVVYGHSRAAALVADMPLPARIQKVGLDGAMVLARNKNMLNLTESGTNNRYSTFDYIIGRTGKENYSVDFSPKVPHRVWLV